MAENQRNLTRRMSKLGKMLVDAGRITEQQLKTATDMQKALGGKLGPILIKLGFINETQLVEFIAKAQGLRVTNLDEIFVPENLIKKISRDVIIRHEVVPISFKNNIVTLAMHDPTDIEALEEVQFIMNSKVEVSLASQTSIRRVINQLFGEEERTRTKEELMKEIEEEDTGAPVATKTQVSPRQLRRALIPLLIEKGVITEEDLIRKAQELE